MLLGSVAKEEEGYSYEEICQLYPHKLASRTTILTILNEGVVNSFFLKNESSLDRRKHNYTLTLERKKDVLTWLDNHPITKINK